MRGRVIGASDRCSCVSACPSKFGVYVKVQRSTDSSSQGRRAVVLYLGRFTAFAWRPSRISSAASRRSPACLWYHPPTVFRAKETVPAGA